jgi:hypothetical protein
MSQHCQKHHLRSLELFGSVVWEDFSLENN